MPAKKTMAQRLGQALETMTRQCGQLPETPAYGSWLLGRVSESPSRRWVRIKRIVTVYIMTANLTGIVVALLVVTFAFPVPSIYTDAPWWVTFGVAPAYATLALAIGTYWITTRIVRASIRWAIEERAPSQADGRNTLLLPFRVAAVHLILWDIGGALLATLYGLANRVFVTIILFSVTICGVLVATNCYLFTEFALRPVAAKALEAGRPPRRFAPGIMGRTMTVWSLGSGVPVTGIATTALYVLLVHNLTETQLASAVLILSITTLIFGFLVMWILAWLTAAPVRVVRAALKRVEQGDLRGDLVVFDGMAQRLGQALETMTRQHDRLRDPPAYGSWLLGWVSERPLRRRVRIQIILTIALITANLVGIGLAVLLENVAFPTPSIVSDAPLWITFVAGPAYTVIGMALGSYYVKVQTLAALRWASEEHTPSRADQRNHRGGGRPDRRRQCRRQAKIRIHSGRQAGQPGGPIVRTGQITPRAIASILGHTARCQRNRTCPLVFGRNRDAARLPPAHPTSLAASAATGKHPPHRRACRGNQDRQIRLTHHVQDAGATPAPGSGDDDPSARPAARSARVRLLAAWVGVRTPAPPPGADSDHPDHRPHHSKPGRDRPGCAVRKCRFSDT
ncbi:adenylate cyclase [Mycobacterium tuberculosis TB_RSA100]|nr:adenylate cyclase [Mycobacterium tuberculosis TB_RSA100]